MFQGGATHPRVCDLRNAFQMSLECGLLESLAAHQNQTLNASDCISSQTGTYSLPVTLRRAL